MTPGVSLTIFGEQDKCPEGNCLDALVRGEGGAGFDEDWDTSALYHLRVEMFCGGERGEGGEIGKGEKNRKGGERRRREGGEGGRGKAGEGERRRKKGRGGGRREGREEGKEGEREEGGGRKKKGRGEGRRGVGENWRGRGGRTVSAMYTLPHTHHTHTTHIPVLAKLLRAEEPVKWTPLWSGDASRACTILGIAPSSPTFIRQSSANIQ